MSHTVDELTEFVSQVFMDIVANSDVCVTLCYSVMLHVAT